VGAAVSEVHGFGAAAAFAVTLGIAGLVLSVANWSPLAWPLAPEC